MSPPVPCDGYFAILLCPASAYSALYLVCDAPVWADILLVLSRSYADLLTLFPSHWVAVYFLFRSEVPLYVAHGTTGVLEMREPTVLVSSLLRSLGLGLLL